MTTDSQESLRQAMRQNMENPVPQAVYQQRKVIVEPVFGQIKNSGFRGFSVRGLGKVAGKFSLVGAAHTAFSYLLSYLKKLA